MDRLALIFNLEDSDHSPQTPERIGKIPSIPTLFPNTPQPDTPTSQRNIDLRNGKKVPMKSKDYLRRLQDQTKAIKKQNDKAHRNHFGAGGSKSA